MADRTAPDTLHGLGRPLALFAPGLPQIVEGRWGAGGIALSVWAAAVGLGAWRADRLLAAVGGRWDERVAAATLAGVTAACWIWSWRAAGRRRDGGATVPRRWARPLRTFRRNRPAAGGAVALAAIVAAALLAPLLAPFDPLRPGDLVLERYAAPSAAHLLGTDELARDVLSRVLYGARVSLGIGVTAAALAVTLGTLVGAVAGYAGGWIESALMRVVDTVLAFPRLVLLVAIAALLEPSAMLATWVLGLTLWPGTARIVRSEVLSVRERDFVLAARALGYSGSRILLRHVVPNSLAPVIVTAALGVGNTIVLEAGLSFLGLGVQAPTPSWGGMVAAGRANLLDAWWLTTVPGLAIALTVLSFNLVGDGLRDALDPRMRV